MNQRTCTVLKLMVVLAIAPTAACGALARSVAREATPGMVEGVVDAAADRRNQEKLVSSVDPDIVRALTGKVSNGVVDGVLDALEDPVRRERLRRDFVDVTRGFQLPMRIDGLDKRSIGDALDESLARLTTPENVSKLSDAVGLLVREAVRGAFAQGREEMSGTSVGAAFSAGARDVAKQATLGFQDAIDETAEGKRNGTVAKDEGNLLDGVDRAAKGGTVWLPLALGAFAALGVVLVAAIVWAGKRGRRARADLEVRDRSLEALLEVIVATDNQPWARELRGILSEKLDDRENVDHLRRLIRARRASRAPAR